MELNGIEFEVKRLSRSQRKVLRAKGISLLEVTKKIQGKKGMDAVPFTEDEMETLLDIAYPKREDDLENLGLMDMVELSAEIFAASLEDPAKN